MKKILFCVFLFVGLVNGSRAARLAATSGPTPATSPSTAPAPPPIRLGDVATQGETLAINLRQMKVDLSSNENIQTIDDELPVLNHEIDARMEETTRLLGSNPSLQILPIMEEDWKAIDSKLVDWKKTLANRSDQLSGQIAELKGTTTGDWQQTLQYAEARNASAEIRQHIEATLRLIAGGQDDIKISLDHLHTLAKNVDEQNARVMDILASVKQARQEAFNRLLVRDSPAVWSLITHWPSGRNLFQDTADSFKTQLDGLSAYAAREKFAFVLHAFVFLLMAGILLWVRRGVERSIEKDPSLASATPVFQSPILTSIVLSFLASAWVYPQAPRLLWEVIGAAALIPTVLILRRLIERRLFPLLNAMVVFYFLDQLRAVVAAQQVLPRLIFLCEMLAGILFLVSFITATRSRTPEAKPGDTLWRAMQIAVRLALVIFGVAFLTGSFGYVSFANWIGDATLGSAYLAVILYATTRIADGLLKVALRSWPLNLLAIIRRHEPLIHARLVRVLNGVAFALWLLATLDMMSLRSAAYAATHDVLTAPLSLGSVHLTLGHLLSFTLTIWAAFFVSRLLRFILEEDVYARFPLSSGIAYAISKMLHYVILVLGFIVAIAALGYDMTSFTILVGAFGVGLGFGMQNIINNFVSGLILLFERPIKVGDLIQLDDASGVVQHIGIRATILTTTDSSEIIVPNGNILSNRVTNWTHSNRQRGIEIPVGVAAGTDPKKVIALLKSVAASHPLITKSPPPQAFFETFGADAFQFRLRAWTDHAESWVEISSDLAVAINSAFVKENIVLK